MRKQVIVGLAAAITLALVSPAIAQAPSLTVDQIDCSPIEYPPDAPAHSTAVLSCVDDTDGIELRLHQLGDVVWLEVVR
jgi:hypothetical protein